MSKTEQRSPAIVVSQRISRDTISPIEQAVMSPSIETCIQALPQARFGGNNVDLTEMGWYQRTYLNRPLPPTPLPLT